MFTRIKTETEIKNMRRSGRILADVLKKIHDTVEPGMSGLDVSKLARAELRKAGAEAPFLGYNGFPDVICISVNDAVVHGIPSATKFREGDIVGFDFGAKYGGMITDSAFSMRIGGNPQGLEKRLLDATEQAMYAAIDQLKDGVRTGDIGAAAEQVLQAANLGIVRELAGHGVGHNLHEDPNIPNFGTKGRGDMLKAGMTIAIEPMATLGKEDIMMDRDGWTIRSADHSLTAHFEHTILITKDGAEILTAW